MGRTPRSILLAGAVALAAEAAQAGEMQVGAAIRAAGDADAVFVGEVHDNPAHHEAQGEFARALEPRAIVFEMISADDEPILASMRAEGAPRAEIAEALDWAESGWPDFRHYAQIMEAARDAAILGANVPRPKLRRAISDGAAAAFGPGAGRYGLDRDLPPDEQSARERRQAEAHCDMLPEDMLPGMVEAQRLRDAALADAVLRGHGLPGTGPVLVITGNGHANGDLGAPALLSKAAPDLRIFAYGQFEHPPEGEVPFDAWRVTDPAPRPDPCAGLGAG